MKNKSKIIVCLAVLIFSNLIFARQGEPPLGISHKKLLNSAVETYQLEPVDVKSMLNKHKPSFKKPMKFAMANETKITTTTNGNWTNVNGGKVWRLNFKSEGATDLNFGFKQFYLPKGAKLYFISDVNGKSFYDGPYTYKDNKNHQEFWSAPMPTGEVAIELYIPNENSNDLKLELSRVSTGFRDVFKIYDGHGLTYKKGDCNIDVVCDIASPWSKEKDSVAAYTIRGIDTCTGTMIMNHESNYESLFLTAAHCQIDSNNDQTIVTIWNYESPECGQLGNGLTLDTLHGAALGPFDEDVDFTLLRLNDNPPAEYGVYWSGWDATGLVPQGSVGIHHPNVDEKAISFNYDPLGNCGITHWEVGNWEQGTTEPGSSGSGLWDIDSRLLVGTLTGGDASCDNPGGRDCYGKISEAWRRSQGNFSFRTVLDPNNTGVEHMPGSYNFRQCVINFIEEILENGLSSKKKGESMQRNLYKLRDNFLYKTSRGKVWVNNYYHFSPIVVDIITNKDEQIAYDLLKTLNKFYPAITRLVENNSTVDSELFNLEDYKKITSVLYKLSKYGDDELKYFIKKDLMKFDFKSYIGTKMDYLVNDFLKYVLYK